MRGCTARLVGVLAFLAGETLAQAGMVFNITNQGGATAQMMTGFNEAAALWSAGFDDPITINIRINASPQPAGVIAHADTFYDPYSYTSVREALVNDRTSPDDFSAASNLQLGPAFSMLINRTANNPAGVVSATPYFDTGLGEPGQAGAENNSTVRIPSANAKALGLYPASSAGLDGIITFSNAVSFDFARGNGINASQIDFVGVAAHEIGHMLGFVSGVDTLASNAGAPGLNDNQLKFVTPLDLFRFSSRSIGSGGGLGVIDWADDDASKYFSINGGATPIAEFSTSATFEASHWRNDAGLGIMDPTAMYGELLAISDNDVRAFDAIGYNVTPTPEPSAGLLFALLASRALKRRTIRAECRRCFAATC